MISLCVNVSLEFVGDLFWVSSQFCRYWSLRVFFVTNRAFLMCWMNEWMNECVFIYRTYHIVSQGGLQFYLSEIGRQRVEAPLAAAISPYLISPTHPTHAWNVQWNNDTTDRPQHRELRPLTLAGLLVLLLCTFYWFLHFVECWRKVYFLLHIEMLLGTTR